MTILRAFLTFALVFFLLPYGVGCLVLPQRNPLLPWIFGLGSCFAVYEALSLVFHFTLGSLRVMTVLWCLLFTIVALIGFFRLRRQPVIHLQLKWALTKQEAVLLTVAILIVVWHTLSITFSTFYNNWDDQTYCANAVTSLYTDTVNRYAPESGYLKPALYDPQYVIPGWTSFCASLAFLTDIHPSIVYRVLLPVIEIPAAYGILYLITTYFFKKNSKYTLLGFLLVEIFVLLAAERAGAAAAPEWWLFMNIWTGKALAANIITPLVMWLMLQLESCPPAQHSDFWLLLIAVCWGCTLISATLYFVIPVELAIWGGFYLLRNRYWREIPLFLVAGLPCLGMAIVCL